MICPNCNAVVSDSMKFCENCGAALPASSMPQEPVSQLDQQPAIDSGSAVEQPEASTYTYEQQGYAEPSPDAQQFEAPASTYGQQYNQQPADDPFANTQAYGQQQGSQVGGAPMPPGVYAAPASGPQASSTPFVLAIIALVTALLGLFPASIVLAIVALVMNSGQRKRGEVSTKQTPTTIMGIISLVLSVIMLIALVMIGGFLAAYVAAEGVSSNPSSTYSVSAPSNAAKSASASAPTGEATGDLAGTWKLTGLVSDGKTSSADEIEAMQNMGLTFALTLKEDGTAALNFFGTDLNGTWSTSGPGDISLVIEGGAIDAKVVGNEIVVTEGEDVLTFTKQ